LDIILFSHIHFDLLKGVLLKLLWKGMIPIDKLD